MQPVQWPHWLENPNGIDLWAKSPASGAQRGESLPAHTWQVVQRLAEHIKLRPDVPHTIGFQRLWHCLFWAALLHDCGKATKGFQAALRPNGPRWRHRHEVVSLAFLSWFTNGLTLDERRWVAATIVSHHRDAQQIARWYPSPDEDDEEPLREPFAQLDTDVVEGIWRWLDECAANWITTLELHELGVQPIRLLPKDEAVQLVIQQGVQRVRAQLQEYGRFVHELDNRGELEMRLASIMLRGLMMTADHAGSAHAGPLATLFSYDYQHIVATLPYKLSEFYRHQSRSISTRHSAVLIAPTGSGKTEAALFWALGKAADPDPPRVFYALPHQASMNAMYLRLQCHFPKLVGLQHGRALQALYQHLATVDDDRQSVARAAKWQKNLTELNHFPVRVFSPYQMLKACYKLRGFESILSDYVHASFIFDEIHAYDPVRLALIFGLVKHLRQHYAARFFVMSATFPTLIRDVLQDALGDYVTITADTTLFQLFRRHWLQLRDGELLAPGVLDEIAARARQGDSVLVCCNTVKRAQEAWQGITQRLQGGSKVVLLHSRLIGRDRLEREQVVREACDVTSKQRKAVVLVATQVVEVSLNIDLDTIYTDPAPLEALIQRFGRINRRRQKDARSTPVHVFRQPDDGQHIYAPALVQATLRILNEQNGAEIDESQVNTWLDRIYQGEVAAEWKRLYTGAATDFQPIIDSLVAFNADESLEEQFYAAFDSVEVLPACFQAEYEQYMHEDRFLEAAQLFVSISNRQFAQLRRSRNIRPGPAPNDRINVALARYHSELGLILNE